MPSPLSYMRFLPKCLKQMRAQTTPLMTCAIVSQIVSPLQSEWARCGALQDPGGLTPTNVCSIVQSRDLSTDQKSIRIESGLCLHNFTTYHGQLSPQGIVVGSTIAIRQRPPQGPLDQDPSRLAFIIMFAWLTTIAILVQADPKRTVLTQVTRCSAAVGSSSTLPGPSRLCVTGAVTQKCRVKLKLKILRGECSCLLTRVLLQGARRYMHPDVSQSKAKKERERERGRESKHDLGYAFRLAPRS